MLEMIKLDERIIQRRPWGCLVLCGSRHARRALSSGEARQRLGWKRGSSRVRVRPGLGQVSHGLPQRNDTKCLPRPDSRAVDRPSKPPFKAKQFRLSPRPSRAHQESEAPNFQILAHRDLLFSSSMRAIHPVHKSYLGQLLVGMDCNAGDLIATR